MDYFLLFLEGIITFISPCILPMFPIYLSYFAGDSQKDRTSFHTILNALGFILGFTIIFTLLGTLAGTFGQLIKEYQMIVQLISGTIMVLLGLNYIGIFKIYFLEKSLKFNFKANNLRFFSSIIFGIIFAVGWTPCVGTFLSSALMIAVNSQNIIKGSTLLLIYSLGLGIPFIICAIFIDSMKKNLNILKNHYQVINKISGTILIIFGIAIMTGQFNKILSFFTI